MGRKVSHSSFGAKKKGGVKRGLAFLAEHMEVPIGTNLCPAY